MVFSLFAPRLYIGDIMAAWDLPQIKALGITAVVSCGTECDVDWCTANKAAADHVHDDVVSEDGGGRVLRHVSFSIDDALGANILRPLAIAVGFVEDVLSDENGGNILIHCWAGMSRSATLCLGHLMKSTKKGLRECLEILRASHPRADPNQSFLKQLVIWAENGYFVKGISSNSIKYASLKAEAEETHGQHQTDSEDITPVTDEQAAPYAYSCKICRTVLFYDKNVTKCAQVEKFQQRSFSRDSRKGKPQSACTSLFIEPMEWMGDVTELTGKISCANEKCGIKLGGFSWHGLRCSCGYLQAPAFQVHQTRVDRLPVPSRAKGAVAAPLFDDS